MSVSLSTTPVKNSPVVLPTSVSKSTPRGQKKSMLALENVKPAEIPDTARFLKDPQTVGEFPNRVTLPYAWENNIKSSKIYNGPLRTWWVPKDLGDEYESDFRGKGEDQKLLYLNSILHDGWADEKCLLQPIVDVVEEATVDGVIDVNMLPWVEINSLSNDKRDAVLRGRVSQNKSSSLSFVVPKGFVAAKKTGDFTIQNGGGSGSSQVSTRSLISSPYSNPLFSSLSSVDSSSSSSSSTASSSQALSPSVSAGSPVQLGSSMLLSSASFGSSGVPESTVLQSSVLADSPLVSGLGDMLTEGEKGGTENSEGDPTTPQKRKRSSQSEDDTDSTGNSKKMKGS